MSKHCINFAGRILCGSQLLKADVKMIQGSAAVLKVFGAWSKAHAISLLIKAASGKN